MDRVSQPEPWIAGSSITVRRKNGQNMLTLQGATEEIPVRIVQPLPLSQSGLGVSFLDKEKREVAAVRSVSDLDAESAACVREALDRRYFEARVTRVLKTETHFGTRYLTVDTDKGRSTFALRHPGRNIIHLGNDGLILRDTNGNVYRIEKVSALDALSQLQVDKAV
jgi:hypothetical protein